MVELSTKTNKKSFQSIWIHSSAESDLGKRSLTSRFFNYIIVIAKATNKKNLLINSLFICFSLLFTLSLSFLGDRASELIKDAKTSKESMIASENLPEQLK